MSCLCEQHGDEAVYVNCTDEAIALLMFIRQKREKRRLNSPLLRGALEVQQEPAEQRIVDLVDDLKSEAKERDISST